MAQIGSKVETARPVVLRPPTTLDEALDMPKHWRLVKQHRKIGGPWFLQSGRYGTVQNWSGGRLAAGSCKAQWCTEYEQDFRTREDAIRWLSTAPDSWGNKSLLLGAGRPGVAL